uniref:Alpha-( )-fucosyltransferase n=1 Tax=Tetraselmis sp. GSL018 TaxID=582737 RepID=A0A061RIC3_9CHLO
MRISQSQPLQIVLQDAAHRAVQSRTIGAEMPVYVWDRVHAPARFVRFSLPGPSRRLQVMEVKVWVEDRDGALCTESSCRGGTCACDGPGCTRRACRCGPTRIGAEDCTVDPVKDWRYLPLRVHGAAWDAGLWRQLMRELTALQSPSARCNAQVHNGLIGAGGRGAGLASTLHFVAGLLSESFFAGRPFVFGGRFNYAGTAHCRKRGLLHDFDCYFEPFSGGACRAVKAAAKKAFKGIRVNPRQPHRCAIGRLCNEVGHFKRLPPEPYRPQGLFWWRSAMAAFLVRANADTARSLQLEDLKRRIGFVRPIIGVHVRHGDACHTTIRKGRCKGLAAYIPEIRLMSERYNTTRVFLATDDAGVIRDAARFPEFTFVHIDFDRKVLDSKEQIEYRKRLWDGSSDDGHRILTSSLTDLLLLAEADALIAHLLSNMSRLALELNAALNQRVPPFSSMDGPWCPHWKMCAA